MADYQIKELTGADLRWWHKRFPQAGIKRFMVIDAASRLVDTGMHKDGMVMVYCDTREEAEEYKTHSVRQDHMMDRCDTVLDDLANELGCMRSEIDAVMREVVAS